MAELGWGVHTNEGKVRAQNEDNHLVHPNLFVVADGMGGHQAGEVASEMTVAELARRQPDSGCMHLDDLVQAINIANENIFNAAVTNPEHMGMGTTVTAIAVVDDPHDGEVFGIANVGDSRAYVLRHRRLRQVTIDHSYVQELVAEGAITRDEARSHPRRNIVTRALGIEPYTRVDSWTMPIIRGDRFVICSDGLTDEVTDAEITDILERFADSQVAAEELVKAANEAGGRDNITAVVIDVFDGDEPPDPTDEIDVVTLWDDEPTGETAIVAEPASDDATDNDAAVVDADCDDTDIDDTNDVDDDNDDNGHDDASTEHGDDGEPVAVTATSPANPARRPSVFVMFITLAVAAILVLGGVLFTAWVRSGYFVAFNDANDVVVYKGRDQRVLWFDPTVDAQTQFTRDNLTDESVDLVNDRPTFTTRDSAVAFVAERLEAKEGALVTPPATTETTPEPSDPVAPTTSLPPEPPSSPPPTTTAGG